MIPGIVAAQMRVAAGEAPMRPVFVSVASNGIGSGPLAVGLPSGWSAGELAVMHVVSGSAALDTPSGWTRIGSDLTSGTGTSVLFWRILQVGDSGPTLSAGTNRRAAIWTFQVGTFNQSTPVSEIATNTSGGGLNTTPSVGSSSSVTTGEHFQMQFYGSSSEFHSVSSYPYASAQHTGGVGSTPNATRNTGCGANFDGGVSGASNFVISVNATWVSRKIAIIGSGYVP